VLTLTFSGNVSPPTKRLVFDGISLSAADIQGFAGMLCVTLGITAISAPLYNFSKKLSEKKLSKKLRTKKTPTVDERKSSTKNLPNKEYAITSASARTSDAYTPILPSGKRMWLCGICAELHLMLSGQPLTWKLIGLGAVIVSLFAGLGTVQTYILPLLMLWFINVFSAMGSREYQHDVLKIITVIPNGRFRQIVFSWISGIFIALSISFPVILRMIFINQSAGVLACLGGVIFLPSFSIFLGEFTKTRRVFELSLTVITYAGFNNASALLYIGTHPNIVSPLRSGIYLAIGIIMGSAAVVKRVRRD
jgi:hypothetical protein